MRTAQRYDAIVAGSGPGGATVARELARRQMHVLVLEWGDDAPATGRITHILPRGLLPGRSLLLTGQAIGMVRGITAGGSSMYYCATAIDPPLEMLRRHGVDIASDVAAMRGELPCAPLPDERMSPAGRVFEQSANALGYDCRRLDKFIDPIRCRADCECCIYGCPHGAKWTARAFIDEAVAHGAEFITGARVERVLVEKGRAAGVVFRCRQRRCRAYAPIVVVAAGGIGSPMILRRSGFADAGRDFFFDPLVFVVGRVPGVTSGRGPCMAAGVHFEEDGIVMTDFNLPQLLKRIFDVQVLQFRQALAYADAVPIMVKIRDGLGGRVINDHMIWKRLAAADKARIDRGSAHARRILENAGAKAVYRSWYLAAHPGGTVKIDRHLDADLQTACEGLYVCDCSVIPEPWGLPPTLTLLGLGRRLARHLAAESPRAAGGRDPLATTCAET